MTQSLKILARQLYNTSYIIVLFIALTGNPLGYVRKQIQNKNSGFNLFFKILESTFGLNMTKTRKNKD